MSSKTPVPSVLRRTPASVRSTRSLPPAIAAHEGRAALRSLHDAAIRRARRAFPLLALLACAACATAGADTGPYAPWWVVVDNETWENRTVWAITDQGAQYMMGRIAAQSRDRMRGPALLHGTRVHLVATVDTRGSLARVAVNEPMFSSPYPAERTFSTVPFLHEDPATLHWSLEPGRPVAFIR
jgi:hypothetical protein